MSGNKEEEDPRINGIKTKIRVVPDFPKKGIMFQDITTVLLDPKAFKDTIDLFVERYRDKNISVVAGNKEEEDPRINGIKTKIRVVPDFPKKGDVVLLP
ncbi:hypothetical protein F2Q68_00006355 [Brassica cretica]|uniref:adenine phosphoribosyltransferase n=1 Tax=Brassica cretica TaxID=69181 RepID=A0A8S9J5U6_BRACR|nr:hypothetical protein F2Q68_00006355 [Brassica cretica]